jgi:tetratricopeptide (TPR) repeat protein
VFLGTSNAIEEGFSLPAVEAMACGIPCVLTDIPCFRAHGDGQYALFVPPDDAAAMAEALVLASRVGDVRTALRTAGLEAASRYTLDAHGEGLLAALEQAVAAVRGTTPRIREARTATAQSSMPNDSDFAPVVRLLGELRAAAALAKKLGQLADASRLEAAARCLEQDSDDLAAASAHARTRAGLPDVGLDDPAAAAQALRAAIAAGARSADVYNRLGVALFAQGDLEGAKHSFHRALLLDPGHRDASANLQELAPS